MDDNISKGNQLIFEREVDIYQLLKPWKEKKIANF